MNGPKAGRGTTMTHANAREWLSCSLPSRFTGKERDAESGNDYFGARYYASSMGRFMSPDPGWMLASDLDNPQSWNQYSYALNNPLTNIDPDGLDCVYFNNAGNGVESVDHNSNSGECNDHGGDWVNGTTSAGQVQYHSDSDNFTINSSDANNHYTTISSAPGSQLSGIPCYGDCAQGYIESPNVDPLNPDAQAIFTQVGKETAPVLNWANAISGCVANHYVLAPAAAIASALGAPVPKAAIFGRAAGMGGDASKFMSGASAAEYLATGGSSAKFTGAAAAVSRGLTGTARVAGAVGRVAGPAALVLDAALISKCVSDAVHH